MAPLILPLGLVLAVLLPLLAPLSNAFPTTQGNLNSLVMLNSSVNRVISHCYTPDSEETPGIRPINLQACKEALNVLIRTPDFTTPFRFSRNPRAMAKEIPMGWQPGPAADCRIVINCYNDHDSAVFRFADVAQGARKIMENCVEKPDPHGRYPVLEWGGVTDINGEETFYVAIARPLKSQLGVELINETLVAGGGLFDGGTEVS